MIELAEKYRFKDEEYQKHTVRAKEIMEEVLRSGTDQAHYFLDEGLLQSRLHLFQEHFFPDNPDRRIIYAMKANPRSRIMEILAQGGIDGFDCASVPEIDQVLGLEGMSFKNVFYDNPIKCPSDIQEALTRGVEYHTAQSESGVKKILDKNLFFKSENLEVAVRVKTPNPNARIDLSTKFGCSPDEAIKLVRHIKDNNVRAGLAMHTGSQNGSPRSFVDGIELLREIAIKSGGISSINLGGGLPVNYTEQEQYDVGEYLREITQAVQRARSDIFKGISGKPIIIIEPGRSIVAPVGDLAAPIIEIDYDEGKKRVFMNDGLFTSFLSAKIHGWEYNFEVITRDGRKISKSYEPTTLHGRTCDSGDTLGVVNLPSDIREKDFLHVRNAGAYMDDQATHFNGFGLPIYVFYN